MNHQDPPLRCCDVTRLFQILSDDLEMCCVACSHATCALRNASGASGWSSTLPDRSTAIVQTSPNKAAPHRCASTSSTLLLAAVVLSMHPSTRTAWCTLFVFRQVCKGCLFDVQRVGVTPDAALCWVHRKHKHRKSLLRCTTRHQAR